MKKIVLIDDDANNRALFEKIIQSHYEIRTFSNWSDSLNSIFKDVPDLLLIDVNMPGLKGDKVAKGFINSFKNHDVKIVLFSAIDEEILREKAQQIQVSGYIQKTFDEEILLKRIEKILERRV